MKTSVIKGLGSVVALALSVNAFGGAITYNYDAAGPGTFGGHGGDYNSIHASYTPDSQDFEWVVDYKGDVAEGGWLVVSNGKNPKNSDQELAILYFDQESNDVWAYAYNGKNNNASYKTTDFLGYFENAYKTVGNIATLALNAAGINGQLDGPGLSFGSLIGIWFHPSYDVSTDGGTEGLDYFGARKNSWYDTHYDGKKCEVVAGGHGGCNTTTVPEPGTLALLGAGLLGFGLRRRSKLRR